MNTIGVANLLHPRGPVHVRWWTVTPLPTPPPPCTARASAGGMAEGAGLFRKGGGGAKVQIGWWSSLPPRLVPWERTLGVTHVPRQASSPFPGGGRARSLGPQAAHTHCLSSSVE